MIKEKSRRVGARQEFVSARKNADAKSRRLNTFFGAQEEVVALIKNVH